MYRHWLQMQDKADPWGSNIHKTHIAPKLQQAETFLSRACSPTCPNPQGTHTEYVCHRQKQPRKLFTGVSNGLNAIRARTLAQLTRTWNNRIVQPLNNRIFSAAQNECKTQQALNNRIFSCPKRVQKRADCNER